jgi:Electron transfer DM13
MKSMTNQMEMNGMTTGMSTSRKKLLAYTAGVVLLVGGWALFRPELLFINQRVNESLPVASATTPASMPGPMLLASGNFHAVAHETKGMASVHQLGDGKRVVRLTGFETSNGPDVRVYLVAASDATDSDTVKNAGFVELGKLKGNIGDQNYDIPAGLDLNKYRAVTIWCARFGVNFGTAPLMMAGETGTASAAPMRLAAGQFHSVAHETTGTASVLQLGDDKKVLRLTDFATSNGPDVRVYLVAASDATDSDTVNNAGFVELGKLKGNIGDQNYDIPAGLDLNKYRAVTIWCARFGVNFGTAPLTN